MSLTSVQLETMLEGLVVAFDRTILVLDGLDIVQKHTARVIFRFIRKMSNQGVRIQLFGTSRVSRVVNDAFHDRDYGSDFNERNRWREKIKTLSISRHTTNNDIGSCARAVIAGDTTLRDVEPAFKQDIIDQIVHQSDGM